jgi:DNA-binding transcriptional LysR family regulator
MSLVLDDLKNFLKICETRNVTRASEIIGISQPALSYSIKRLERELGGELIIRLKNGVRLTKLGEEFSIHSRQLITQWEMAQKLIHSESSEVTGEYSIGIHPSVALYSVDKFLPELTNKYPLLNFKLVHGLSREMTEKVINWEIDFGIVVNPIRYPDLVIKELCKDVVTLFSTDDAPKKLIMDPELAQSQHILKKLKQPESMKRGHIISGNLEVIAKMTAMGLGQGLLPSRVAANYPNLKPIKGSPTFNDKVCLIYRKEKHKNETSKDIIKTIGKAEI